MRRMDVCYSHAKTDLAKIWHPDNLKPGFTQVALSLMLHSPGIIFDLLAGKSPSHSESKSIFISLCYEDKVEGKEGKLFK